MSATFVMLVLTFGANDKILAVARVFQTQALCEAGISVISDELHLEPGLGEFRVLCLSTIETGKLLKRARCLQQPSNNEIHSYVCEGIEK